MEDHDLNSENITSGSAPLLEDPSVSYTGQNPQISSSSAITSSEQNNPAPLAGKDLHLSYSATITRSQKDRLSSHESTLNYHAVRSTANAPSRDRRTNKYVLFAALLTLLTTAVVVVYYLNHPQPEQFPDTMTYLNVVNKLQTFSSLSQTSRVPGFPLLIVLVFALTGQGNLLMVSIANAILFIMATIEIYVIAALIVRNQWLAFLIGLLVGINVLLIPFIKPILSEAMALWLLVSLVLLAVIFVYTLQARYLWLVASFSLALCLTRPEWMYLPVLLFLYLLLVAREHTSARRILPHALGCILLVYVLLGGYLVGTHFAGVAEIQNINLWGKILVYHMQDEASPQYTQVRHIVDSNLAQGINDPRYILDHEPLLASDHYALAGAYARSVILHHPVEFILKTVPVAIQSLTNWPYGTQGLSSGPYGTPLLWLQSVFRSLYNWNQFFLVCAVVWISLLGWRRTRRLRSVQALAAIVFVVLYGLIITSLAGYQELTRYHVPLIPLMILVIWISIVEGSLLFVQHAPSAMGRLISLIFRQTQSSQRTDHLLVAFCGGIGLALFTLVFLFTQHTYAQVGIVFSLLICSISLFRYIRFSVQK